MLGTLTFPLQSKCDKEEYAAKAGCNLLTQTPEIASWLASVRPGERLILGAYAYARGRANDEKINAIKLFHGVLIEKGKSLFQPSKGDIIPFMEYNGILKEAQRWIFLPNFSNQN